MSDAQKYLTKHNEYADEALANIDPIKDLLAQGKLEEAQKLAHDTLLIMRGDEDQEDLPSDFDNRLGAYDASDAASQAVKAVQPAFDATVSALKAASAANDAAQAALKKSPSRS
ncbi:hypothetical protein [Secundilactobacillus kimchicus]|uniref:hypothetical protein n=1 Tax=Secundilactobacillus kimchicus TaxID=528209 RepID=UPI0006CFE723|nr:hypothetical protein [Secundilactobacillus kimchicus]